MQNLCGLDKSNCKDNILSLIKKLAVEVVSGFDIRRNEGNTYRVFSYGAILRRRKAAGLEWVTRRRGVQFVDHPPIGESPIGDNNLPRGDPPTAPEGDTPIGPVGETPPGPMGASPTALRKERKFEEGEPSSSAIWEALRPYVPGVDDDAVRQLAGRCRAVAPDSTEEEIAYFIRVKAEQMRSGSTVRNPMGFLQAAVPKCFEGAAFQRFRREQSERQAAAQRRSASTAAENAKRLAEQKAVLADPNASPQDKQDAYTILEILGIED